MDFQQMVQQAGDQAPAVHTDIETALITAMQGNLALLRKQAEAHEISNLPSAVKGLEMAMQARKMKNGMEKTRKEITKPHLDFQRAVKSLADSYLKELEKIESDMIEKLTHFREETATELEKLTCEDGSMQAKFDWLFEIEDKSRVPAEFLTVDMKAVEQAVKEGVRNIEGVRIYKQEKFTFRVK